MLSGCHPSLGHWVGLEAGAPLSSSGAGWSCVPSPLPAQCPWFSGSGLPSAPGMAGKVASHGEVVSSALESPSACHRSQCLGSGLGSPGAGRASGRGPVDFSSLAFTLFSGWGGAAALVSDGPRRGTGWEGPWGCTGRSPLGPRSRAAAALHRGLGLPVAACRCSRAARVSLSRLRIPARSWIKTWACLFSLEDACSSHSDLPRLC